MLNPANYESDSKGQFRKLQWSRKVRSIFEPQAEADTGIEAARTASLGCFDTQAVNDCAARTWLAPTRSRSAMTTA